jgi:dolichol-phosphate mannosyltransferase
VSQSSGDNPEVSANAPVATAAAHPRVILALPAYNEAENLPTLLHAAQAMFTEAKLDHIILVVNDGSTDDTAAVVDALAAEGIAVERIDHPRNRGLGAAIRTSIHESLARSGNPDDIVVNMDADDTHDPAYIPGMVAKIWTEGQDIVIASRFREGSQEVGVPFGRRVLSRGARLLFRIFLRLPEVRDYTCGYRAYRASTLQTAVEKYGDRLITREGFACTDELLVHLSTVTRRVTEVPFVLRYDKKRGKSKLPLFKTIWETLKMLVVRH